MSNDYATPEVRVARGAGHLDKVRPSWYTEVDLHALNMGLCGYCVIGQLTGSYYHRDKLGIGTDLDRIDPINYGFEAAGGYPGTIGEEYRKLTHLWTEAIQARRKASTPA